MNIDFFAVIGMGPNDVEIPLVIFSQEKEAKEFVAQFPKHEQYPHLLSHDFIDSQGEFDTEEHPLYKKLFKDGRYYSGCGGCYELRIEHFEFGEPMVGWDLD